MNTRLETSSLATALLPLCYAAGGAGLLLVWDGPYGSFERALILGGGVALLLFEILVRRGRVPRRALAGLAGYLAAWALLIPVAATWPAVTAFPFDLVGVVTACCPLLWIAGRMAVEPRYVRKRWFERLGEGLLQRRAWLGYAVGALAVGLLVLAPAVVFFWLLLLLGALGLVFPATEIRLAERDLRRPMGC